MMLEQCRDVRCVFVDFVSRLFDVIIDKICLQKLVFALGAFLIFVLCRWN